MALEIGQLIGEVSLEDSFSEAMELVAEHSEISLHRIEEQFGALGVAVGATVSAIGIAVGAITTLGFKGSTLVGVEGAFNHLAEEAGTTGEALRGSLTEGVKGTVDEMKLMTSTMTLLQSGMKLTTEQAELMGTASRAIGTAMGTDAAGGLNAMTQALATGQTRMLQRQIGLIDVKKGEEAFAASLGVTAKKLNAEGLLEGKRLAIFDKLRENVERAGATQLSFKEKIEQATIAVEDWFEKLEKAVATSPQVNAALDSILDALKNAFGGEGESAIELIVGWINKFADIVTVRGPQIIQFFVEVKDTMVAAVTYAVDTYNAIPQWFFNIAEGAVRATAAILATAAALAVIGAATETASVVSALSSGGGFFQATTKMGESLLFVKQSWVTFRIIVSEGIAAIVGEATGLNAVLAVLGALATGPLAVFLSIVTLLAAGAAGIYQVIQAFYDLDAAWKSGQSMWDFFTAKEDDNFLRRWLGLTTIFKETGESIQGLGIDAESMSSYVDGAGISAKSMAGYVDGLGNSIETAADAAGRFNDTPLILPGTSEIAQTKGFFDSINLSLNDLNTVIRGFVGDALKGLADGIVAAFKTIGDAILGIIDKVLFGLTSLLAFIPGLGPLGKAFDGIGVNVSGLSDKINSAREALHNLAEGYKQLHPELNPPVPTHAPVYGSGLPHDTSAHGGGGGGATPNYLKDGTDKLTAAQKAYNAALLDYNSSIGKDYLSVLSQVGNATYEGVVADSARGVKVSSLAILYGTTTEAIEKIKNAEAAWNKETNTFNKAVDEMTTAFHGVPWDGTVEGALKLGASVKDVAVYFGLTETAVKGTAEEVKTWAAILGIEATKSADAFAKSLKDLGSAANAVDFKQLGSSATEILKAQKTNDDFSLQQSLTVRDAQVATIWKVVNEQKAAFAETHQASGDNATLMLAQQQAYNEKVEAGARAHVDALKQNDAAIKANSFAMLEQQAAYDKATYEKMAANASAYTPQVLRHYQEIAAASQAMANGSDVDWNQLEQYSLARLQEILQAAQDTYAEMGTHIEDFSNDGILAAARLVTKSKEAFGGLGTGLKNSFEGVIKSIPDLLGRAFEGGGGLVGAMKSLGVALATALTAPMLKQLQLVDAKARAMGNTSYAAGATGAGAIGAGAVGGVVGGTSGAVVGSSVATIAGSALVSSGLMSAATIGGAVALGLATAGIGLAAVGAYLALKKMFSLSADYKAAKIEQADLVTNLLSIATEAEQASAPLTKLDKDGKKVADTFNVINVVARDAFTQAGYSAAQAEVEVKKLLDTKNAKEFAKAMTDLAAAIKYNEQRVKDLEDGTNDLVSAYQKAGSYIPTAMIATINKLIQMKGLTEDQKKALQDIVDSAAPDYAALTEMAGKYGISLDALGPKFQQMDTEGRAKQLYQDFMKLTDAGADVGGVLLGMSGAAAVAAMKTAKLADDTSGYETALVAFSQSISGLVESSLKFGTAIPDNMKPLIENLMAAGKLTDENGVAITDISQIKFEGTPLDQGLDKLNKAIDHLADVLSRIPGLADAAGSALSGLPAAPDTPAARTAGDGGGQKATPRTDQGLSYSGGGSAYTVTPVANRTDQTAAQAQKTFIIEIDGRQVAESIVPELPGAIQRVGLGR